MTIRRALLLVGAVALLGCSANKTPTPSAASSASSDTGASAVGPVETTTTEAPTTTTLPPPVELSGSGDDVIDVQPRTGPSIAHIVNKSGGSNFSVWAADATGNEYSLLVNTIGGFEGTVAIDFDELRLASFHVSSDRPWSITLMDALAAETFTDSFNGQGDNVMLYAGSGKKLHITNAGGSNFAVWLYGSQSSLLVNEIGAYDGTVPAKQGFLAVTSDSDWTITSS